MAKRIKLGLFYNYDENWIGGTYYTINLIKLLSILDVTKQPIIYLFHDGNGLNEIRKIRYKKIIFKKITKPGIFKKKIDYFLFSILKVRFFKQTDFSREIDIIVGTWFPSNFECKEKLLYWIPDFQDKFFPDLFDSLELESRRQMQLNIANNGKFLILSSQDALNHFNLFYKGSNVKTFIYRFCSFIPDLMGLNKLVVFKKYNINNEHFYIAPNQFWAHKNHIIILKALSYLKRENKLNFNVYFTGKEHDYRNLEYVNYLKNEVLEYNLSEHLFFLGFIEREDQLFLMKQAVAVIQPSLFEGWSTVIEDSKALNKVVIASNLTVHKEQLGIQGLYFNPYDELDLANLLSSTFNSKPTIDYDYERVKMNCSDNLFSILTSINYLNNKR